MERPNKEDYDFNDVFEGVRFASNMIKYADYLEKQLSIHVATSTLPNINSKIFKDWLIREGYEQTLNELVLIKNDFEYDKEILYRAFANELEFGN